MPSLLAFDTATEQTALALCVGERFWLRESPGGVQASANLIPQILALLAEAGVGVSALDAIAVGRGPGAFTGLRTACAVAQGLAYGADKPVLLLDTLMAVAEDAREGRERFEAWVAVDARMDEAYAGRYRHDAGRWQVLEPPMLIAPEALAVRWSGDADCIVAGNALSVFGARLATGGMPASADARPRAAALLALARAAWRDGAAVDAARALPLYLRDKVALTTAEREQVRRAKEAA